MQGYLVTEVSYSKEPLINLLSVIPAHTLLSYFFVGHYGPESSHYLIIPGRRHAPA